MNWTEQPWLVIDTETTGIDPATDRIVELAAVGFQDGTPLVRKSRLVNPGRAIPVEATAMHGIGDIHVASKPTMEDIAPNFVATVRSAPVIVAYNAPFDLAFLANECPGFAEAIEGKPVLDPLVIVRFDAVGRFWKGEGRHKLASVHARLGLPTDGAAHRAGSDATMTGRVLWALRAHLPVDARAASYLIAEQRAAQDANFLAWKSRQPAQVQA